VWKFLSRAKRNNNEKRRNKTLQICPSSSGHQRSRFAREMLNLHPKKFSTFFAPLKPYKKIGCKFSKKYHFFAEFAP